MKLFRFRSAYICIYSPPILPLLWQGRQFYLTFKFHTDIFTAAKFKDCARSCKVCFFCWNKSFFINIFFNYIAVICCQKSSICKPSAGLRVVVFEEHLIKLRYIQWRLKIKQFSFICVIYISFQFVPGNEQQLLGFSLYFQRKKLLLTQAVKYFSAVVMARYPCHVFGGNSRGPSDFRFLLSYSYNSCIFWSLRINLLTRKLDI